MTILSSSVLKHEDGKSMYPGIHASRTPDKPAVVMAESGRVLSHRQLDEHSAQFARVLHDAGLRRGDVVAILSGNTVEFFGVYWAAMRSGLFITAINRHLSTEEVACITGDSGARALVASAALAPRRRQVRSLASRSAEQLPATSATRPPLNPWATGWWTSRGELRCCNPRAPPAGRRA
jgi:acyl-CoA synthetase (AMP-forming)/AMP-acid ligase II